jgi:Fe2+ or Zn2+ uptake regulation protein
MQERQTKQKLIIYDALKALDHPTATEVYGYVREQNPTVSRATVFRVLGGFADHGKARELRAAGSEVRYDYNVTPHYHARCECCGKVADVKTAGLDEGCLRASAEHGFSVRGYSVEFFGVCKNCQDSVKS